MTFKDLKDIMVEKDQEEKSESPKIASDVADFLQKVLPGIYDDINDVRSEKSAVIIENGADVFKRDKEELTNTIQQYIVAVIGKNGMDDYKITGPFKTGMDLSVVFQDK